MESAVAADDGFVGDDAGCYCAVVADDDVVPDVAACYLDVLADLAASSEDGVCYGAAVADRSVFAEDAARFDSAAPGEDHAGFEVDFVFEEPVGVPAHEVAVGGEGVGPAGDYVFGDGVVGSRACDAGGIAFFDDVCVECLAI